MYGVRVTTTLHSGSAIGATLAFLNLKCLPYIDIHDLHLSAKDVINSGEPHTQILYTHLSPEASYTIKTTQNCFNNAKEDVFIWSHNMNELILTYTHS
jgi:hypothetical protein